ncbi:unnamed protein product, partial [Mesorhabditis spiculigera]
MRVLYPVLWILPIAVLTAKLPVTPAGLLRRVQEVPGGPADQTAKCRICMILVDGLQRLLAQNSTDEELIEFGINTCKVLKAEQTHVCDTIVPSLLPEVLFMMDHVIVTPDEMCADLVQDCGHETNVFDVLWPLKIPDGKPPVKPWPQVQKGKPTLRVLHLSDIHVDRQYQEGSEAQCDSEEQDHVSIFGMFVMCCRNYPPGVTAQDGPIKKPAGKWGTQAKCDLPYQTFISAMSHISRTEKLDYIIITGDLEAHDIWDYTKEKTAANIANITAVLREFFPTTPIFQSVGNHEGVPSDAMAPHGMDEYDTRGPQWLYAELAKDWGPELGPVQRNDVHYRASWAQYVKPGLKLIAFNSIYCSQNNFYLYINQVDPDGTLEWLIEQLVDAEQKGDKVHLFAHIPSGNGYCLKGWSFNFYEIVNRFESTIAAQFYGHTHVDQFEIYYDQADFKKRPVGVNLITPSLTTNTNNNPAYRIYTIDGDYAGSSYTVLEIEAFYANLTAANENGQEPVWELEYKATEAYGMKDLSPQSWHDLTERFLTDAHLFAKYYHHYNRYGAPGDSCSSNAGCRKSWVCGMRTARSHDTTKFC